MDMLNAVKSTWLTFQSLALRQSKDKGSDEGLTLQTSANILFTAFSISQSSTLHRYIVLSTATPTQTKTSSYRDKYCIVSVMISRLTWGVILERYLEEGVEEEGYAAEKTKEN